MPSPVAPVSFRGDATAFAADNRPPGTVKAVLAALGSFLSGAARYLDGDSHYSGRLDLSAEWSRH